MVAILARRHRRGARHLHLAREPHRPRPGRRQPAGRNRRRRRLYRDLRAVARNQLPAPGSAPPRGALAGARAYLARGPGCLQPYRGRSTPMATPSPPGSARMAPTCGWRAGRYPFDGALGPVLTLSAAGQNAASPGVATDADGDSIVTWYRSDGTNDRSRPEPLSAAGVMGNVLTLSAAGQNATAPEVATDADRSPLPGIASTAPTGGLRRARSPPPRSWDRSRTLSPGGTRRLRTGGCDRGGRRRVSSSGSATSGADRVPGDLGAPDAGRRCFRGAARRLSTLGQSSFVPEVASQRRRRCGRRLGHLRRHQRPDPGETGFGRRHPSDPRGRSRPSDGTPSRSRSRSTPSATRSSSSVRLDGAHSRVQARTLSSAAVLGATETLSAGGHDAVGPSTRQRPGRRRDLLLWQRSDGTNFRVQSATGFPPPPPPLTDRTPPGPDRSRRRSAARSRRRRHRRRPRPWLAGHPGRATEASRRARGSRPPSECGPPPARGPRCRRAAKRRPRRHRRR